MKEAVMEHISCFYYCKHCKQVWMMDEVGVIRYRSSGTSVQPTTHNSVRLYTLAGN